MADLNANDLFEKNKKLNEKIFNTFKEILKKCNTLIKYANQKKESDIIAKVSSQAKKSIIDCGGGVVLNDKNIENLKKDGVCIVLTANLETIIKRIRNDKNRPPLEIGLSFEEEQKQILEEREEKYRAAADFICNTSNRRPVETVEEITEFLKTKGWI